MEIKPYLLNYIKNVGKGGGILPTGTINITENGTVDVTNYASANVNVSSDTIIDGTVKFGSSTFTTFPSWLANATFTGNLYGEFGDLYSLVSVPNLNISNPTSLENLFENCYALENVGLFDLGNVTSIQRMFNNCYKLKKIAQYDTSKIQYFNYLFYNCREIEDIPVFNTSNVASGGFRDVFRPDNSTKLTNESLNNILQMCINAVNISSSYKKLKTVGLSQTQAQTCTTLSNWQACVNAGWTTGY